MGSEFGSNAERVGSKLRNELELPIKVNIDCEETIVVVFSARLANYHA